MVEEVPTATPAKDASTSTTSACTTPGGAVLELGEAAERVTDTIAAVWRGECESDP